MGTLTLDEIKSEVRASFGQTKGLEPRLTLLINQSQERIARAHSWEELRKAGTFYCPGTALAANLEYDKLWKYDLLASDENSYTARDHTLENRLEVFSLSTTMPTLAAGDTIHVRDDAGLWKSLQVSSISTATNEIFFASTFTGAVIAKYSPVYKDHSNKIKDILSIRLITSDGASRKLEGLKARSFDGIVPEPEFYARRKTLKYVRMSEGIEVWPIADKSYECRIRYIAWPTALKDEAQKSDLEEKDDIIIALTNARIANSLQMFDEAARWFAIYRRGLEEAIGEDNEEPDTDIKPDFESFGTSPGGDYWRDPFISKVR